MDVVISIIGIMVLGFLLNVLFKQSYNLVFFLEKKPVLWVFLITLMGGLFWFFSGLSGLSVSTAAWATTMAVAMNFPPRSTSESKEIANEMYLEMGIKHGPLLYRLGLAGFVISALAGWVIFYGKTCNSAGECSGFL